MASVTRLAVRWLGRWGSVALGILVVIEVLWSVPVFLELDDEPTEYMGVWLFGHPFGFLLHLVVLIPKPLSPMIMVWCYMIPQMCLYCVVIAAARTYCGKRRGMEGRRCQIGGEKDDKRDW